MIDLANADDIPQIVALGYQSFNENGLSGRGGATPDFDKVGYKITACVMNGTVFVSRNVDNKAIIDGVVVLEPSNVWWSSDNIFNVLLLFIKKDKRSLKQAIELVNQAKKYGIMYNYPVISGLSSETDYVRKAKLLKYLGFQSFGSTFVFTPNTRR